MNRSPHTIALLAWVMLAAGLIVAPKLAAAQSPFDVRIEPGGATSSPGVVSDPPNCLGPLSFLPASFTVTNDNTPQLVTVTVVLDPGLQLVPGSCSTLVGVCNIVDATHLSWSAMLAAQQQVSVSYEIQVGANVPAHTELCETVSATFGTAPPIQIQVCVTTNSDRECGLGAPALGPASEAVLAALLLLAGVVLVRRKQA